VNRLSEGSSFSVFIMVPTPADTVSSSSVSDSHFCGLKCLSAMRSSATFSSNMVRIVGYYIYNAIELVHKGIKPGHLLNALEQSQHLVNIAIRLVDFKVKFAIVLHR